MSNWYLQSQPIKPQKEEKDLILLLFSGKRIETERTSKLLCPNLRLTDPLFNFLSLPVTVRGWDSLNADNIKKALKQIISVASNAMISHHVDLIHF